MTTGWVKSLQCKSKVLDDVVTKYGNSNRYHYHHIVPDSSRCRKSVEGLKDVIETNKTKKPRKPKSPELQQKQANECVAYTRRSAGIDSLLPALKELPEGHPSRNVLEIIFHTSWSNSTFPGRVEMVFKVQHLTRTLTSFEEYRETVKARASSSHSRCVADGNEVMRFCCVGGPTNASGGAWGFCGGKGVSMCTYSGSGGAHQEPGRGNGIRAMLVCRVIAGRVLKEIGIESKVEARVGYDSVCRENDELFVFDSRAVLPCFLIIYKL